MKKTLLTILLMFVCAPIFAGDTTPIYQVQDQQQRKVNEQFSKSFMTKDIKTITQTPTVEDLEVKEIVVQDDGTSLYFWYRNERDNKMYGVKMSTAP